ncbi:hypothetical protein BH23GEM6_BH23GEM6_16040 [soil metagenome]
MRPARRGNSKGREHENRCRQPSFIESVGAAVPAFAAGDEVFAFRDVRMGCHAEYVTMPAAAAIARRPRNLSFEECAALSFGGTTALAFLRRARIQRGESVLIVGASGCVGTAAVQLARHFGAHVTGVCSSGNAALVESVGADAIIAYDKHDFSTTGARYDIIMDTTGTVSFARARECLDRGGRFLAVAASLPDMLQIQRAALLTSARVIAGPTTGSSADLRLLAALAEAGEFRPVIDRC